MTDPFFDHPILNSPYEYPKRHWELDDQGQPTQQIIEQRRRAQFITPIPKPKKRKGSAAQQQIVFDEGKGLSSEKQQYDITATINRVRQEVDAWRNLPTPAQVTPETARLSQHWRHHKFNDIRPCSYEVEAIPPSRLIPFLKLNRHQVGPQYPYPLLRNRVSERQQK
jgi:type III restriction enzyme